MMTQQIYKQHVYKENVDIYTFPSAIFKSNSDVEITLGDLHGNAMKLIFMLVLHGILKISPEDYKILVDVYTAKKLNHQRITQFNTVLSRAKVNNKGPFIRLIGDVLADRGSNDYLL